MSADLEFNGWRTEWQAQAEMVSASPAYARRDALRQQQRLRVAQILELLLGVALLAGSGAVAWKMRGAESLLWAVVVWLTTLIASAFSVWNWQTLWEHDLKSVAEFLELYEKRCQAKLRAARFGNRFVVLQSMISLPWLTWDYHRDQISVLRYGGSVVLLILLSVGFSAVFRLYRRSALREIEGLRAIRKDS